MKRPAEHQYIDRETGHIRTERLYGDQLLNILYQAAWEKAPSLYHLLTSARFSHLLGMFCYDSALGARLSGNQRFLRACRVNLDECLDPPQQLDTARKVFERKIRYWDCRPLPTETPVVSPADARVIVGSFKDISSLFLKEKFFHYEELLDPNKTAWVAAFADGEFALFRLTPDKYHYNHTPVAGMVRDFYEIPGAYQSCNPSFLVASAFPYAKNKRVVTIIDTDVPNGSQVGLVAMIEIVALMIGDIVQCYSQTRYDEPCPVSPNMFLHRGQPKSLYRPGSSTTVLLFQPHRLQFAEDLIRNRCRPDVKSRFSQGLGRSLVETDVEVRSPLALRRQQPAQIILKQLYTRFAATFP
jgi:phosphatidylserine decarboxylase